MSSGFFKRQRGIRQGCCVSPYLFLLVVEIMAAQIRQNNNIQGVRLQGVQLKIVQYVDDSTCLLNSRASLQPLLQLLLSFRKWSGLSINRDKSMILLPREGVAGPQEMEDIPVVPQLKVLGIWIFQDNSTGNNLSWNPIQDQSNL